MPNAAVKSVVLRIAFWWTATILGGAILLLFSPDQQMSFGQVVLRAICVIAMLVSLELGKIETVDGRAIALSLALLFGYTGTIIFLAETNSIRLLVDMPIVAFYLGQYANAIYNTLLLFCATFLLLETTLSGKPVHRKYLAAIVISGSIGVGLYYPMIENPRYAYMVPDIVDFVSVDKVEKEIRDKGIASPNAELIAGRISLPKWDGSKKVGTLSRDERIKRVEELQPYTRGFNYIILVHSSLRLMGLYMNLVATMLVVVSIIIKLVKDPPQGAYRDKLSLAFLMYLIFEIIHEQSFREVTDWNLFLRIDEIGKLVTTATIVLIMSVEIRRYRFLSEAFGKYYESVLAKNPLRITRWRDEIDRVVLKCFFKRNRLSRRFLQKRR